VKLGAIVIVTVDNLVGAAFSSKLRSAADELVPKPLPFVEVAGKSPLERIVDRFLSVDTDVISILIEGNIPQPDCLLRYLSGQVTVQSVSDIAHAIAQKLNEYSQNGVNHSFVCSTEGYVETDLLDFFYFHRGTQQNATRAFNGEDPLKLWVVDCAASEGLYSHKLLAEAGRDGNGYLVRGYVGGLRFPSDLRTLAVDILAGRCETGPSGVQIRPGVWIDQGADIHQGARIVASAYIGRRTKIRDGSLITRFSCIESDCYVDCGTVVENSSVLTNTKIGIWLDVRNSIVSGNKLLSLERGVTILISDRNLLRPTVPARGTVSKKNDRQVPEITVDMKKPDAMSPAWRFGAKLIEE
jgi:hypothetical protein